MGLKIRVSGLNSFPANQPLSPPHCSHCCSRPSGLQFRVGRVLLQVFGRQVRVPLDHFWTCPATEGLDGVGRHAGLHQPACPGMPQVVEPQSTQRLSWEPPGQHYLTLRQSVGFPRSGHSELQAGGFASPRPLFAAMMTITFPSMLTLIGINLKKWYCTYKCKCNKSRA